MIVDFKKKGDSQWKKHGQRRVQRTENVCPPVLNAYVEVNPQCDGIRSWGSLEGK